MARHLRNFINADDFELFFSVVIDKKKLKKITANDKISTMSRHFLASFVSPFFATVRPDEILKNWGGGDIKGKFSFFDS